MILVKEACAALRSSDAVIRKTLRPQANNSSGPQEGLEPFLLHTCSGLAMLQGSENLVWSLYKYTITAPHLKGLASHDQAGKAV